MKTIKPIGQRKTRTGMKVIHIPKRMWEEIEEIKEWLDRDLTTASVILECMDVGINWYYRKMQKPKKAKPAKAQPAASIPNQPQENNTTEDENSQEGWEEFDRLCKALEEQENRKIPPND